MKKILSIVFIVIFALSLTACNKEGASQIKEAKKIDLDEGLEKEVKDESKNKEEIIELDEKNVDKEKVTMDEKESKTEPIVTVQQTLLILDASGSMWGQIDGKTKISIAKDVVKSTIKHFEDTELGLMAYGHRKKGDCEDIEILTAPQKNNAKNISKMVDGISPKGMTPMGNSVLMAAESLKYTEQKATVILVSDGIETCDVDLCELGKKLEETGVDFTAHVIGFDMTEDQIAGLKCLANETGGTFTLAKDAEDLSKALEKTVEASSCSKEKLGEAIITVPLEVQVNSDFEVHWTGPNGKKDVITLLKKDDDNQNNHFDYVSYLNDKNGKVTLKAPKEVGEYDVVYFADCGTVLGRFSLKTLAVSAKLTIPETVAAGSKMDVSWVGPNNSDDQIGIFPKDDTDWNNHLDTFSYLDSKSGIGKLTVPNKSGEYDVLYWLGGEKILARKTFQVTDVIASISFDKTINIGSKFNIKWTGPNNHGDALTILPKGSSDWNDHIDTLAYLDNKNGKGELTAPKLLGSYDVVYWLNQKKILARKTFTVTD